MEKRDKFKRRVKYLQHSPCPMRLSILPLSCVHLKTDKSLRQSFPHTCLMFHDLRSGTIFFTRLESQRSSRIMPPQISADSVAKVKHTTSSAFVCSAPGAGRAYDASVHMAESTYTTTLWSVALANSILCKIIGLICTRGTWHIQDHHLKHCGCVCRDVQESTWHACMHACGNDETRGRAQVLVRSGVLS